MDPAALHDTLHWLAANHHWTWAPECRRLLFALPGADAGLHPVQVVDSLTQEQLNDLLADAGFLSDLHREIAGLDQVLAEPVEPEIAYCSPEFAIDALVPQYAGGLGVLAGDHLKAASDLATPLAGVGLFYQFGYFTQAIEHGHQVEHYQKITASDFGAVDTGHVVAVPMPGREVQARVWRLSVGRVPLLLLDTNIEANAAADRDIADRLYGGDRGHRLAQEVLLGVGGAKALAAHGWNIRVHHLNEGHAGFIILEMIDRVIRDADLQTAVDEIGPGLVFTTHTPVAAGIDRFHKSLVLPYLEPWATRWGVALDEIWALGEDPDNPEEFNMAALALRVCSSANGVSQLHGEVSREIFAGIGCGDRIGAVTNGVHARTWVAPPFQTVFDEVLGPAWAEGDGSAWDRVEAIDDDLLESMRHDASARLADLIASTTGTRLDPDALILGFARRFAPYKRATLLLQDRDHLGDLLANDDLPIHLVFAGKSHPHDDAGKGLIAEIVEYATSDAAKARLTFIPGYDMAIAATLVEGCDVWLNTPVRPREASGTSGEKAALNGVLNCSILDGWWAEMYDGHNGWEIASSDALDPVVRDQEEAASLYEALLTIRAEYHGDRAAFKRRIRHAWRTLGPKVTAARMVRDYRDGVYGPALGRTRV